MNDNENALIDEQELENEQLDFDALESQLEVELEGQMADLELLKEDRAKIANPESLGTTVMNVVWEQFINQVGVVAGEDFIKENRGLNLDLSKDAHIQTADNFAEGKIATHNYISKEQLKQNYDRYKNAPHGKFRKEYVNPGMDATLKRAGTLYDEGVETVKDVYTGRQIPTQTKLEDGRNNPLAAQREHVVSSAEAYQNPSLQMANSPEKLAAIINNPENLQGYTTAERNNRKSDCSPEEMEDRDRNKHWEKANERAKKFIKEKEKEGEDRLRAEGQKTRKEEAFRMGGKALRAALMGIIADLVKKIAQKLIAWLRAKEKSLKSFIAQMKAAIHEFIENIKQTLLTAGDAAGTAIATAIIGPVVATIKKAWIFLKQGYKSLKEAIQYVKDAKNKNKPFGILMLEVSKIVMAGVTAGGAIVLGEVIEKALMSIPIFAVQIPLIGSLANILGIFFGSVIAGIVGALALSLIDKAIAKRQVRLNEQQQFDKRNEILCKQGELIVVTANHMGQTKYKSYTNIVTRHQMASDSIKESLESILQNSEEIDENNADGAIDNLMDDIENL